MSKFSSGYRHAGGGGKLDASAELIQHQLHHTNERRDSCFLPVAQDGFRLGRQHTAWSPVRSRCFCLLAHVSRVQASEMKLMTSYRTCLSTSIITPSGSPIHNHAFRINHPRLDAVSPLCERARARAAAYRWMRMLEAELNKLRPEAQVRSGSAMRDDVRDVRSSSSLQIEMSRMIVQGVHQLDQVAYLKRSYCEHTARTVRVSRARTCVSRSLHCGQVCCVACTLYVSRARTCFRVCSCFSRYIGSTRITMEPFRDKRSEYAHRAPCLYFVVRCKAE